MSKTNLEIRDEISEWVNRTYLGPFHIDENGEPDKNENISFSPLDMYSTGILFPQSKEEASLFNPEGIEDGDDSKEEGSMESDITDEVKIKRKSRKNIEDDDEEDLRLTTEFYPSSLAISSIVDEKATIKINVDFGKYFTSSNEVKSNSDSKFTRKPISLLLEINVSDFSIIGDLNSEIIWEVSSQGSLLGVTSKEENVSIKIIKRKQHGLDENQTIVTVSLINTKEVTNGSVKSREGCLFQPKIIIDSSLGFVPFPDNTKLEFLSEEEIELKFLYRNYKNYCLGHGCGSNWSNDKDIVSRVESSIIPSEKINGVDFNPVELDGWDDVLFMKNLSDLDSSFSPSDLISNLKSFTKIYEKWILEQNDSLTKESISKEYSKTSSSIIEKCSKLLSRMNRGIDLLEDKNVLRAFLDANRAMFMQRVMSDFAKHRSAEKRTIPSSNSNELDDLLPDFEKIPYDSISSSIWQKGKLSIPKEKPSSSWFLAKWRPFQLAFILSQIEGIVDTESEDRETIDLLWFPTGGGKTEAYLGLISFTIFLERLKSQSKVSGVSVMMRYTLRMLNKQQFDRANILICACELIRYKNSDLYGTERVSNGLWVGGSFFPNKHSGSRDFPGNNELLEAYKANVENKNNSFTHDYAPPVFNCPCCGNKLVKELRSVDGNMQEISGKWGYNQKKNRLKRKPFTHSKDSFNPFVTHCTNSKCHFYLSDKDFLLNKLESQKIDEFSLPIYYVDEDVYRHRPTLLFSTVDKYAQLSWKKEVFRLFNFNNDFSRYCPPPSLIVQDELHLISSSLGTIYSLFEFAIDELTSFQGSKPKIVGATATVRNAKQQCIKIYDRKHYSQFPPVGVHIDDSFYSRKKTEDKNGRLYLGVMASGNTSTTAKLRLDSLLYEGVNIMNDSKNSELDNYYTLLAYFNTVKELGKYRTLLEDDMNAYRKFLSKHFKNMQLSYNPNRIVELSSQMTSDEINFGLDRLENTRLQLTDLNNEIVNFLSSIGINTKNDLEQAKYKWNWISVFNNHWEKIKELVKFSDSEKIGPHPYEEEKVDIVYNKCYPLFEKVLGGSQATNDDPVKVALATNMIAVGVDIPRLNVMSISGQPKTTAEYIQASSRVGRQSPGIVLTLYNQAKNRDRSHYENFKDYHQAYYKYVEATSVTPFSLPALEKTLDSVVIALMRGFYFKNENTAYFDTDAEKCLFEIQQKLIDRYLSIIKVLDIDNKKLTEKKVNEIKDLFKELEERWKNLGSVNFTEFKDIMNNSLSEENLNNRLFLDAKYRDHHMTRGKMLFAMTSLRDVDTSAKIKIKSYLD
ncbi:helicase-like protein [Dokdonia sp. Hel_I_63]|uniref:helicase-related protein n=1 Tax=Dokdonia sp. Hel_I_63 TaxID=1249996 RepID=UPI001199FECB|nr:helicase-related protein [Dokdonia sp. Hel_I_63]TVZ24099.1 helicase-like protein [Dokdonia sp. Hel_I_63]